MIFEGTFNNYNNSKTWYIKIGDTGVIKPIVDTNDTETYGNSLVCFALDPVSMSCDLSDTFENVYIRSCTIALVANYNISRELTASNYTDILVVIRQTDSSGDIIFKGYVEPLSFNQPYAYTWNRIELNCVDLLGIAEYIKFPALLESNDYNLSSLDYMKPRDMIGMIMDEIGLTASYNIPNDMTDTTIINPNIFIGESKDEWKSCKDVLDTIGKTYGAWFCQNGEQCDIFNILRPNLTSNIVTLTKDDFVDTNANLSLEEAYNQINLTCNIDTPDDTLVDPFDDDLLHSPFSSLYEYMEEIVVPGEGNTALESFKKLIRTTQMVTNYDPAAKYKHYAQVYVNPLWDFGSTSYATQNTQLDAMNYIQNNPGSAGFISFGKSENINNPKDSQSIHSVDMTNYFVINVNGQERTTTNAMDAQLQAHSPICSVAYTHTQNFIPNDRNTTNYLVISGKILLQPIVPKTGKNPESVIGIVDGWLNQDSLHYIKSQNTVQGCLDGWSAQRTNNDQMYWSTMWHRTIPHPENKNGAYYQHKFTAGNDVLGLFGPIENEKLKKFKYEYSGYKSTIDRVDKVSVLACRLKIGSKYCVERLDQYNGINRYEWIDEENLPTFAGHTLDYFTIGFDPKIDDYIIGTSFDICDTRTIEMNIEEKGTCIPITYNDKLHGNMTFEILGPYNTIWEETKKVNHGWWIFGSTGYSTNDKIILEYTKAIFISNFKIKLVSNNAGINNATTDNDLVYSSKENVKYIETKEYDTDLCTALTTAEAAQMGIEYNLTNNAILNEDFTPFYGIDYIDYNNENHEGTKLEEARVYEQYALWKIPREKVEVTMKLNDTSNCVPDKNYKFSDKWQFDANSIFRCIARDIDLKYDTMKCTLKNMKNLYNA